METFKSYIYKDGKHDFSRAYRETLIFQMINDFNRRSNDPRMRGNAAAEVQEMTVAQKRRVRNEIVRLSSDYVKEHPDASINDTDVIVDAFFNSNYGKKFASERAEWEANSKQEMIDTVSSWTTGQPADGRLRFTVSPYDPQFANGDLFDDEHDEIGYVVGATKAGGKPGIAKNAVGVNDANNTYFFSSSPNKDVFITGVVLGDNSSVREMTDGELEEMYSSSDISRMYGAASESGYNDIKHYIKSKTTASAIRSYMIEATRGDNPPLTDDERRFMVETCKWLSDNGIDFEVKLDDVGTDKCLVASLGARKNIRLLDRAEPQYQGRIFDNGVVGYVSISSNGSPDSDIYQAAVSHITADDRLNAIKWYFGEEVSLQNSSSLSGYEDVLVGDTETIRGSRMHAVQNNRFVSTSRNKDYESYVTLGLTDFEHDNIKETLPISFKIQPQRSTYKNIIPYISEYSFNNASGTLTDTMLDIIPSEKIYPEDMNGDRLVDSIPADHRDYYRHSYAREILNTWVESAKDNHREAVNIDDIVDCYQNYYTVGGNYEYHFSANEDIAEIQKLYWDILVGVKETGKTKNHDFDEGLDAFDDSILKASLEDKVSAIKAHYDNYSESAFGRVPELKRPFLTAEENAQIESDNVGAGFDPTMVAKYANVDESYSLQRNYDYIRHMLTSLGDDYDSSFIKDGSYMANEIKRDMVKYDPSTAVCQRYAESFGRNIGIDLASIMDRETHEVDYDELYKIAPGLKDKPVTTDMLIHTATTLAQSGCIWESVEVNIDDNGIISYRGAQSTNRRGTYTNTHNNKVYDVKYDMTKDYPSKYSKMESFMTVSGEIGQIFEPDENGCIIPNYGGTNETNKVIIPGYDAYLVANDPDNPTSARERLRLSDWQHQMKQAISSEIHKAAFSNPSAYNFIPHTTDLNRVYRHTYDTEMTVDEYHDKLDVSKSSYEEVETFKACIETLKGRCRFPNEYGDGSTTEAQSMLEHPSRQEAKDYDYFYSDLNDNRNLRVLDNMYDGIFDEDMTGTAKTQGLVRYLVPGVEINSDTGEVTAADYDPADPPRCALMRDAMMRGTEHDTWDRKLMSSTQVLTALRTPRNVGVAMLNLKGDTFDDGFTVSKAFADKYQIKGHDGELRSLIPQDKLADKHGNKGVITRVVDPTQHSSTMINEVEVTDISDFKNCKVLYRGDTYSFEYHEERDEKGSYVGLKEQAVKALQDQLYIDDDICEFFGNNPGLDIVASPYSGMSRFNGGTVRDLMNAPSDLKVKGETIEGGMGHMDMIVVDMPADVKTHWYDNDAIREGKGRKASGQLLWVLNSVKADKVTDEMFGDNNRAWANFREYAIVTGMDLTEDLKPVIGYHEQTGRGERRRLITMLPQEEIDTVSLNTTRKSDYNKTEYNKLNVDDRMLSELNKSGGFMELPFQLDFKTVSYTHLNSNAGKELGEDAFKLQPTGSEYTVGGETHATYGLPVLPPSLRSGQDFKDGTSRTHDYTNWYLDIANQATLYRVYESNAAKINENLESLSGKERADAERLVEQLESKMTEAQNKAQSNFDKIVRDVVDKQFNTKYNVIREQCMAKKLPSSATAVISAGINLKSDEVAMSTEHAVQLGIMSYDETKDEYYWSNRELNEDGSVKNPGNGRVLLWRDPILRGGAVRYMNVKIDNSALGIKINPAMGKSFDGDFDGDSYAVVALKTKAANDQAFSKFHISNNLLDLGTKDEKTGKYPLFINSGMDMTAIMHADKTGAIKQKYDELVDKANMMQAAIEKIEAGEMTLDDFTFEARSFKKVGGKRQLDENGNFIYDTNPDGSYKRETLKGKSAMNACKFECKSDLDEFVLTAFNDIGTDHIVVKDPSTVVASCQRIVDSGAKGNQDKMRSFMDNVGIDYQLGDDGRALIETAKNITHEVDGEEKPCPRVVREGEDLNKPLAREENMRIQETAAYKADNTQLGGTSSQNGVSAFRDTKQLIKILELTYPTTQAILQSKHDPKDAKIKDEIVRFWGRDIWDGYKLTGDWNETDPSKIQSQPHNRIVKVAKDANGDPIPMMERVERDDGSVAYEPKRDRKTGEVIYETYYEKCTPEEWVKQMSGMMKALKVDVNEDYFRDVAAEMTSDRKPVYRSGDRSHAISHYDSDERKVKPIYHDKPVVMGVSEYAEHNGSLLDRIAYTGRMTAFVRAGIDNQMGKTDESIVGNAIEKGAEIYGLGLEMRKPGCKNTKEIKERINAIKSEIDASGSFVSKDLLQEAYGDKYRAETGSDENVIYRKNEEKFVKPVPMGRRDCQVSDEDYYAGARVMGETDLEYKARCNSIRIEFDDDEVEVPEIASPEEAKSSAIKTHVYSTSEAAPTEAAAVKSPAVSDADKSDVRSKQAEDELDVKNKMSADNPFAAALNN